MKAVILERRGEWAAALREDGTVVKTRAPGQVGETVELAAEVTPMPKRIAAEKAAPRRAASGGTSTRRWVRSAIAAVLALALVGGSATYYTTAVAASYVSVDVGDTSVELSVNRLGNVIGVTALNAGSTGLAEALTDEVKNVTVDTAVKRTMNRLQENGSLDGGQDVIVGVTGENERRGKELSEAVERGMEQARQEHRKDTKFYTVEGTRGDRDEAMNRGMSPGRFFAENDYRGAEERGELSPRSTPPAWMDRENSPAPSASPRPQETQAAAAVTMAVSEPPAESESAPASEPTAGSQASVPTPVRETPRPTPAASQPPAPGETGQGGEAFPAPETTEGQEPPFETGRPRPEAPEGSDAPAPTEGEPVESREPGGEPPAPGQDQAPGGLIPGSLQPAPSQAPEGQSESPASSGIDAPAPPQGGEEMPAPTPVGGEETRPDQPPAQPGEGTGSGEPVPVGDQGGPDLPPGVQEPGAGGGPMSRPFPGRPQ